MSKAISFFKSLAAFCAILMAMQGLSIVPYGMYANVGIFFIAIWLMARSLWK